MFPSVLFTLLQSTFWAKLKCSIDNEQLSTEEYHPNVARDKVAIEAVVMIVLVLSLALMCTPVTAEFLMPFLFFLGQ
jgi:hypothetical protein